MSAAFARAGRWVAALLALVVAGSNGLAQIPPPIQGYPVVPASASVPQPIALPLSIPSMPPTSPPRDGTQSAGIPLPMPLPSLDPAIDANPMAGGQPGIPSPNSPVAGPGNGPRGKDYPASNITVNLGGRVQMDLVDYVLPNPLRTAIGGTNPLNPGVSFRRLRLDASGAIYDHIDYMVQIDFVNATANPPGSSSTFTDIIVPTDAWVHFKDVPIVGNIKVGNQKPLYSFEHLTSSRYLNFMERSLGFDAFAEGFNNGFEPGVTVYDTYLDKRGTWGVGVFKNTRSAFPSNVGRNEVDVNGRVTILPIYEDEGRYLLHMGVGASQRDPDNGQVRFRTRFDERNTPSGVAALVADTGLFNAAQQYLLVPELVGVYGPLSFQSEYYGSWVSGSQAVVNGFNVPQGTAYLCSLYAEAHLFLTGEYRHYNQNSGVFSAVKPLRPMQWNRSGFAGWGAWQLTARYTYLDLNSKLVLGGRVNDMTLGLNWFLNQYMKVQWNFSLTDRQAVGTAGDGTIYGFGTRMAFDF